MLILLFAWGCFLSDMSQIPTVQLPNTEVLTFQCTAAVDENIAECAGLAGSRNNVMFICRACEKGPEHFGESFVKTETEQAV